MLDTFENFFGKEWVQISTSFAYIIVLFIILMAYWRISSKLKGKEKESFVNIAYNIYGIVFFLLIAPAFYLILYFFGGEPTFMLKDPIPWVCLLGGGAAVYDLLNMRRRLKNSVGSTSSEQETKYALKKINIMLLPSLFVLIYGIIMVVLTNLFFQVCNVHLLWFFTFMISGLAALSAVVSKALCIVLEDYLDSINSDL